MLRLMLSGLLLGLRMCLVLARQISVTSLDNEFGASVADVDLNNVTDAAFDVIHDALLRYKVIVVRKQQDLTVEGQRAFTRRFGQLHIHLESSSHLPGYKDVNVVSNIKNENGSYIGLYGAHVENLHSDLSWHAIPTKVTVVKSVIRPDGCGDTVFVDSTAAYAALSTELKESLRGLRGRYSYLKMQQGSDSSRSSSLTPSEVQAAQHYSVHPLVISHPITGRRNLYANPSHTVAVEGWDEGQSAALLESLFRHTARREFSYLHVWQEGDLLIWDNRAVQHRATGCPDSLPRKLVRTTVSNDEEPTEGTYTDVSDTTTTTATAAAAPFDLAADRRKSPHYHPELTAAIISGGNNHGSDL